MINVNPTNPSSILDVSAELTPVTPVDIDSATAFSAKHAHIWAEGTDAEVEDLGGEHSSKEWAEIAKEAAEHLVIDSELSTTSENAVQNKVVTTALNGKQPTITGAATSIVSDNLPQNRALVSNLSGKVGASGVTISELLCLQGATGSIQTQLNGKQPTITGAASSVVTNNLTAQKVVVSDSNGKLASSIIGFTELDALQNVTGNIQSQLNGKQATITGGASTIASTDLTASKALVSDSNGKVAASSVTSTELGYVSGVTSAIQTQLNGKQPNLPAGTTGYFLQKTADGYTWTSAIGADQNLSNLTDTGKNIANWSTNVSNCLVEIPQNAKLDVDSGRLYVRAGSIAYIPNGNNAYTTYSFSSDIYLSPQYYNNKNLPVCWCEGLGIVTGLNSYTVSALPATPSLYVVYYVTDENKCYFIDGDRTAKQCSLPLSIVNRTADAGFTEIVQNFNGFGYVGSTVFILPGVKVAIPNGRNSDGTLNNTIYTVSDIKTNSSFYTGKINYASTNSTSISMSTSYAETNKQPATNSTLWYNYDENKCYRVNNSGVNEYWQQVLFAKVDVDSTGKIQGLKPCKVPTISSGKAYTDLSNLDNTGKNISNWSTNITNCLTSIPQNIKLSLSNNTITLAAGSKLYRADGTYLFTYEDETVNIAANTNADGILFYNITDKYLGWAQKTECYAQDTTPSGSQYMLWFDTANSIIKHTSDTGTTWTICSMPLGTFTATSGTITSIDRTFNSVGFIGNCAFMLPNVAGLYPNGRNADGTLNNLPWRYDGVCKLLLQYNESFYGAEIIKHSQSTLDYAAASGMIVSNTAPGGAAWQYWYCPAENKTRYIAGSGSSWFERPATAVGKIWCTNQQIYDIEPYEVYSDIKINPNIFPQYNNGITITIPLKDVGYWTAPQDGWVSINLSGSYRNSYKLWANNDNLIWEVGDDINENTKQMGTIIPVKFGTRLSYSRSNDDFENKTTIFYAI